MHAKLIDGKFVPAPRKLTIDGTLVYNPTPEQFKAQGYKPLQESKHGTAPEGMVYAPRYEDTGESIKQTWALEVIPASPEEMLMQLVPHTINTFNLDANTAIRCLSYHPTWEYLYKSSFKAEKKGYRFQHDGKLYETVQPEFTFQEQWVPGADGTASIYSRVEWQHAGTVEDPIPVPNTVPPESFTYVVGKVYDEDGVLYLCKFGDEPEGTEHSFPYKPSQNPTYFTKAE